MADEVKTRRRRAVTVERAASNIVSLGPTEARKTAPTGYSTYTRMYKNHPIVRAVIDKIAKSCVAAGYQFVPRYPDQPANDAHVKLLSETFARSRTVALLKKTYTDLLIYGDAYWFITKSRLGVPYAFSRVAPSTVTVVMDEATGEVTKYITRSSSGVETQFDAIDFIHFLMFDPDNDVYGLSPLESLTSTVAQDLFAQTYNESFFANNAQTGIIFNMKNASREEIERNREFLRKEYVGGSNAHKPLLLEGDVEVQRSVSTPADMQFIEGRRQLTTEILAVYDMPFTKMGGTSESANRSQSSENDKSYRAETIAPLQNVIEESLNEHLIVQVFKYDDVMFEHRDVDPRDEEQQMKLLVEGMSHGIFELNHVRAKLGLGPVPGGDEPFIQTPLGLVPVSRISEAFEVVIEAKRAPSNFAPAAGEGGSIPGANLPKQKEPLE